MNNLVIKKYDESIIKSAKQITKGSGFFSTYDLNDGNIIKVVKTPEECFDGSNGLFLYSTYNIFIDELYNKLTKSIDIDIPSIVLPNCIYLDNNVPRAYTIPKQDGFMSIKKYLLNNNDLNTIATTIINITKEVKKANKNGINMPDLGNSSNTLIDPKSKKIRFIDYDGMQIDKYPSFCNSGLIDNNVVPFTSNKNYCKIKTGLVTNNMDKLSLYALFILYTTKTLLTSFSPPDYRIIDGKLVLKEEVFYNYTKMIGIDGTELEKELYKIFFGTDLSYPDSSIKQLLKTHKFDNSYKNIRFIKK